MGLVSSLAAVPVGVSPAPGLGRVINWGHCETVGELGAEVLCPCSLCHIVPAQFCLEPDKGKSDSVKQQQ